MVFKQCIAFATDLAANFGCNQSRKMPDVISKAFACCHLKLLCCSIQIWADTLPLAGFSSIEIWCFAQDAIWNMQIVPMSYFYSESNEWFKGWVKLWTLLWSATISLNSIENFILHEKGMWLVAAQNLQSFQTFLTLKLSLYSKNCSMFSSSKPVVTNSNCHRPGSTVFVLANPTHPSCAAFAGAQLQEPSPWFWSKNLQLPSGIAFGSDCQMICRALNLDSNLNSAAWPTGCRGFICSQVPK